MFGELIDLILSWGQRRRVESAINDARKTINEALKNPATTEEHKKAMQKKLEELDKVVADSKIKRVKGSA